MGGMLPAMLSSSMARTSARHRFIHCNVWSEENAIAIDYKISTVWQGSIETWTAKNEAVQR